MSTVTSLGMNIISRYDRAGMLAARSDMGALEAQSSKLGKAMKAGMLIGAVATVAIGVEAIKSASKFQSSMLKIKTQAGATSKDVGILSSAVLKLAPSTQQGPEQLSEALYHLKSVGMDNVTAMKALRTASDLAAVGGADLESTTNALAGAWRTGIKGAQSFGQTAATVNAIIGAGNMTMEDFTAALSTGILPSAKTFGLSMGQVGSALALFTDEGVPAQAAATRLRMSISLLGAPSMAAEKQLKKIGLTGLDLANAMRGKNGIIGAIGLLKQHLDDSGMSASESAQLLSHAFGGGRSSSAILSMINNFDVLKKKQTQVNDSLGKYGPAVVAQRKTAAAQLKILESSWQTLMIQIGNSGLLTVATKALQGLGSALNTTAGFINNDALPAFELLGKKLGSLIPVDAIKANLSKVTGFIGDFLKGLGLDSFLDKLNGTAAKVKKAQPYKTQPNPDPHGGSGSVASINRAATAPLGNKRQKGLAKGPHVGGSIAPLSMPKTVLPAMPHFGVGNVAPTTGKMGSNKGKVPAPETAGKSAADSLMNVVKNLDPNKMGQLLGTMLKKALDIALKGMADLGKLISDLVTKTDWIKVGGSVGKTMFPMAVGMINGIVDGITNVDMWKKHWLEILIAIVSIIPIGRAAGLLSKVFEHLPFLKILDPALKGLSKAGKVIEKYLAKPVLDAAKKVWGGIKDALFKEWPELEGSVAKKLSGVGKWFGDVKKTVETKVSGWFTGLGRIIGTGIVKVINFFKDGFKTAGNFLKGPGERIVNGLTSGISTAAKAIGNFVKKWLIDPQVNMFKTAGSWLKSKGTAIVTGLKNGVSAAGAAIGSFVKKWLIDPQVNMFKNAGSWLKSKGSAMVTGLKNGVTSIAKTIGSWIKSKLIDPQVNMFKNAGSWLKSKGSAMVTGLKNGVTSIAKTIGSWIKSHVITPQVNMFKSAGTWLKSKGAAMVTGLKNGVTSIAKTIGSWVKSHVITPQLNMFKNAKTWLKSAGSAMISGLKNGITGALGAIGTWVKSHIYTPIVSGIKKAFKIKSPSKVTHELGGHVANGFVNGLLTANIGQVIKDAFGSLPKALGKIVEDGLVHIEDLPGKAMKALSGLGGFFANMFGGGSGKGIGAGVAQWKNTILAVLSLLRQPASLLGVVERRMNLESGGNPLAINLTDSNAKAGHPSQGLMQTIPSTFQHYAGPYASMGITNPFANIYAGLNYALSRYGSISKIDPLTHPGGYANGTPGARKGWAWTGERGPELTYMRGGEKVIPHTAAVGMGGQEYHFHFEGATFAGASKKQMENIIVEAARDAQRNGRIKKGTVSQ